MIGTADLPPRRAEAGRVAYSVFLRLASDFGEVRGFRKTLDLVRDQAEAAVRGDVTRAIPLLFRAPELAPLFAPGGRYAGRQGLDELIQSMTKGQLEYTTRAREKASVILAFAAFDTMVTDLLRIVGLADPAAFRQRLNDRKVPFDDVLEKARGRLSFSPILCHA